MRRIKLGLPGFLRRFIPLVVVAVALGGSAPSLVIAQTSTTVNESLSRSIKPSLVALSVPNVDEAINWYRNNLGFVVKEKKDFPQYSLRIAFLELNGFEIELVEDKKSVSLAAIHKYLPEADDGTKIQGFVKLAFTVGDVAALASRLKSKGVRFQIDITKSNRKEGTEFFIVRDNNGNWLQFSGKSK
jgi:catechol 2,3-dioxygenase-like lactoylglutathione lyase family enzyme